MSVHIHIRMVALHLHQLLVSLELCHLLLRAVIGYENLATKLLFDKK